MTIEKSLQTLQDQMATTDLLHRQARSDVIEFLIKRHQRICLRMDGNGNHKRGHIHIDYGRERHAASYAIDNGERLAGNLSSRYDKQIQEWIADNART